MKWLLNIITNTVTWVVHGVAYKLTIQGHFSSFPFCSKLKIQMTAMNRNLAVILELCRDTYGGTFTRNSAVAYRIEPTAEALIADDLEEYLSNVGGRVNLLRYQDGWQAFINLQGRILFGRKGKRSRNDVSQLFVKYCKFDHYLKIYFSLIITIKRKFQNTCIHLFY